VPINPVLAQLQPVPLGFLFICKQLALDSLNLNHQAKFVLLQTTPVDVEPFVNSGLAHAPMT
jgi:hypothetical protein